MLCPKCKVEMRVDTRGKDGITFACRNKQCSEYKKISKKGAQ